jgi:hypothetical protein
MQLELAKKMLELEKYWRILLEKKNLDGYLAYKYKNELKRKFNIESCMNNLLEKLSKVENNIKKNEENNC